LKNHGFSRDLLVFGGVMILNSMGLFTIRIELGSREAPKSGGGRKMIYTPED